MMFFDTLFGSVKSRWKTYRASRKKKKAPLVLAIDDIHLLPHYGQVRSNAPMATNNAIPGAGTVVHNAPILAGPFHQAHHVVLNNANFYGYRNQPVPVANDMISTGRPVLEVLMEYTDSRAYVDSSARHPPPSCHQSTQFNMIWLHGPAGTGKSAVAQTFAMECEQRGRFGASYFFSHTRGWNKYVMVIPSLAYQLAVQFPPYRNLLASAIANDPQLLRDKAPPVQFTKLIIRPFQLLQIQGRHPIETPFLVLLDGLDECESQDAQCELIHMIADAARNHRALPFFWLICSHMEEHLQYAFSGIKECGRDTLAIDAECCDDVERFLRSEFAKIKATFYNLVPSNWPSEADFSIVMRAVSGLFIFGSTVMKDIGSAECANPVQRLQVLISFLENVEGTASTNPLQALDLFYARILSDVPETIFPTTWRILAFLIYMPEDKNGGPRKPRSAQFYHASFQDFLLDPQRSGRFFISKQKARVEVLKSSLFWHEFDSVQFHAANGRVRLGGPCQHDPFPNFKWVSEGNHGAISTLISKYAVDRKICWESFEDLDKNTSEPELLSLSQQLDYRYLNLGFRAMCFLDRFLPWVLSQDPSGGPFRTKPCDDIDHQLLSYMNMVIEKPARPAALQGLYERWTGHHTDTRFVEYLFIGKGYKSIIVWNQSLKQSFKVRALNRDRAPTLEMIAEMRRDHD
ncbi:hypothetical protein NP233_g7499 [Leucocoprinus birnbaumii]|uniref:Nephrocystin 3-like N-terminal domain-containing protein n=1 Tax=Leucocoprinus birnbaumii TaxID=56174 RepID=A0AAD5VP67_9AGAR|nr:hypothetical protein NP233_g7499 [Leucocoprinus birnbaumii]